MVCLMGTVENRFSPTMTTSLSFEQSGIEVQPQSMLGLIGGDFFIHDVS